MNNFSFELVNLENEVVLSCSVGYSTRNEALEAGNAVKNLLKLAECSCVVIFVGK